MGRKVNVNFVSQVTITPTHGAQGLNLRVQAKREKVYETVDVALATITKLVPSMTVVTPRDRWFMSHLPPTGNTVALTLTIKADSIGELTHAILALQGKVAPNTEEIRRGNG